MRLQRFVHNSITLIPALPARVWTPGKQGVGAGMERSASGVPSAWATRWDRTLEIVVRLMESEWPAFEALLDWAQAGNSFAWRPDTAAGTSYTCYLLSPSPDELVRPTRGDFPGTLEITIVIARTDGAAIDEDFFPVSG